MTGIYSFVGGMAFIVMLISGIWYGGREGYPVQKKIFHVSGLIFVSMLAIDMLFDVTPAPEPKPEATAPVKTETVTKPEAPAPVKAETVTKPEPPKVERPEKSFYAESYDALRQVTGLPVTDSWLLEFGEYVDRNGHVNTHGFVEFNDDDVKRQFWLMFDNSTRQCLRVKVDSQLLYTAVGW